MNTLKTLCAMGLGAVLTTSCLTNDDPYTAGFSFLKPTNGSGLLYANNVSDTIVMFSYGDWAANNYTGYTNSFATLSVKSGHGGAYYAIPISFTQNTTGEGRMAGYTFTDTAHPGDAYSYLLYYQYATRGDGSLGSAADVRAITGSDGSLITLAYDELHRPTSLTMKKGDEVLQSLAISYNDRDSIMYVNDRGNEYQSFYYNDYQPAILRSSTDTITYATVYASNYLPIAFNYRFDFRHIGTNANTTVRNYFNQAAVLGPDSLHCVDSLFYYNGSDIVRKLGFAYSALDNRHQTVDVNQLLLGVEACDPYLLLSLYRYCRSTNILSRARNDHEEYRISAEINANGSVARLTVTKDAEPAVVYTFEY